MSKEENKLPAFVKQLGHIRVAIWANETGGRTFYNSMITRQYRDRNEEFHESNSFNGQADLILVQEAASLAASWVDAQERRSDNDE